MQTMLAKTVSHGIILFDGSLTAGTMDTPVQRLREILSYARRNQSTVLAFSKATTLRSNGLLITEQLPTMTLLTCLKPLGCILSRQSCFWATFTWHGSTGQTWLSAWTLTGKPRWSSVWMPCRGYLATTCTARATLKPCGSAISYAHSLPTRF